MPVAMWSLAVEQGFSLDLFREQACNGTVVSKADIGRPRPRLQTKVGSTYGLRIWQISGQYSREVFIRIAGAVICTHRCIFASEFAGARTAAPRSVREPGSRGPYFDFLAAGSRGGDGTSSQYRYDHFCRSSSTNFT